MRILIGGSINRRFENIEIGLRGGLNNHEEINIITYFSKQSASSSHPLPQLFLDQRFSRKQ